MTTRKVAVWTPESVSALSHTQETRPKREGTSIKTKQKISRTLKAKWADPEFRKKMKNSRKRKSK